SNGYATEGSSTLPLSTSEHFSPRAAAADNTSGTTKIHSPANSRFKVLEISMAVPPSSGSSYTGSQSLLSSRGSLPPRAYDQMGNLGPVNYPGHSSEQRLRFDIDGLGPSNAGIYVTSAMLSTSGRPVI